MSPPSSQQWIIRGSIASAVLCLVVAACVTRENPRPTCEDVADGGQRYIEPPEGSTYFAVPSTDAQATTALGIDPDPGPTCTNCKAGDGYEIMTVVDFEEGFGPAWINYGEPGATVQPPSIGDGLDADGGNISPPAPYFGLQAADLRTLPGGERCGSRYALHLEGGYFVSWGAGYATQYMNVRGAQYLEKYCPGGADDPLANGIGKSPMASGETCSFWTAPVAGQPSRLGIDVSQFDGVSLWARRGPGGQAALRVALLDSNTAQESALDDERHGQAPACRRVVSCCRVRTELTHTYLDSGTENAAVPNQLTVGTTTDMRCWVPDAGPQAEGLRPDPMPPFRLAGDGTDASAFEVQENYPPDAESWEPHWVASQDYAGGELALRNLWDGWNRDYKTCCPATKEDDPIYGGNDAGECTPYIFHYDQSSGFYCHYPDQPPLPEKNENRCEDGFEAAIILDTEWKLYRIPWSELRRSTLGRAPFDPSSVWTIRLYPGAGWLDTYIDDIGFYRKL